MTQQDKIATNGSILSKNKTKEGKRKKSIMKYTMKKEIKLSKQKALLEKRKKLDQQFKEKKRLRTKLALGE